MSRYLTNICEDLKKDGIRVTVTKLFIFLEKEGWVKRKYSHYRAKKYHWTPTQKAKKEWGNSPVKKVNGILAIKWSLVAKNEIKRLCKLNFKSQEDFRKAHLKRSKGSYAGIAAIASSLGLNAVDLNKLLESKGWIKKVQHKTESGWEPTKTAERYGCRRVFWEDTNNHQVEWSLKAERKIVEMCKKSPTEKVRGVYEKPPSTPFSEFKKHSWSPFLSERLSVEWIQFGSSLSSFLNLEWFPARKNKHISQTGVIVDFFEKGNNVDSHTHEIVSLAKKIISRGKTPLVDFSLEEKIVDFLGLETYEDDWKNWFFREDDFDYFNSEEFANCFQSMLLHSVWKKSKNNIDLTMFSKCFDSERESRFFSEWIPKNLGNKAFNFIVPQARIKDLKTGEGKQEYDGGRVDFLFCSPWGNSFIVELDGDEKQGYEHYRRRDQYLKKSGEFIEVIRVSNSEIDNIENENGQGLRRVIEVWEDGKNDKINMDSKDEYFIDAYFLSSNTAKIFWTILKAFEKGVLKRGQKSKIYFERGCFDIAKETISSFSKLFQNVELLLNSEKKAKKTTFELVSNRDDSDLSIFNEPFSSVFHEYPEKTKNSVFIRSCHLSFPIFYPNLKEKKVVKKISHIKDKHNQIKYFLNLIFRKKDFREQQLESVSNMLEGKHSLVLLPTGAGKSIIYQLSSLIIPGKCLIVDPIVALIDDQEKSLFSYGIDKTANVQQGSVAQKERSLERSSEWLFLFIAPERFFVEWFREEMMTFQGEGDSFFNMNVIDEAHCVSEWGHQFRPSYLHVVKNTRKYSDLKPPILLMTGTASLNVYRDMKNEVSESVHGTIFEIRPKTPDRKELIFQHIENSGASEKKWDPPVSKLKTLRKQIKIAREVLGGNPDFFKKNGRKSNSIIVFTPHRNGHYGCVSVNNNLKLESEFCGFSDDSVAFYCGKKPKALFRLTKKEWTSLKKKVAEDFINNKKNTLVATKAFGMGVDKPNIRCSFHFGAPASLEDFYQEAGRAGRDGKESFCSIICDFLPESLERKLSSSSLEEVSYFVKAVSDDSPKSRSNTSLDSWLDKHKDEIGSIKKDSIHRSDLARQLYFHSGSFNFDLEMASLECILSLWAESKGSSFDIQSYVFKTKIQESIQGSAKKINSTQAIQKALHRLTVIGYVEDYLVDYRTNSYTVIKNKNADIKTAKKNICDYIERIKPGSNDEKIKINKAKEEKKCLGVLVRFIYDQIERSRYEAMLQVSSLLRETIDNPEKFRDFLMGYMSHNATLDSLMRAVENTEFNSQFPKWFDFVEEKINSGHLSQLETSAERLLPEHPGKESLYFVSSLGSLISGEVKNRSIGHFQNVILKIGLEGTFLEIFKNFLKRNQKMFSKENRHLALYFLFEVEKGLMDLKNLKKEFFPVLKIANSFLDQSSGSIERMIFRNTSILCSFRELDYLNYDKKKVKSNLRKIKSLA